MKVISNSPKDTERIATEFSKDIISHGRGKSAVVVGLYGDLGSGKTTFTKLAAKTLGVEEEVTSPTFIIEKIYKTKDVVFSTFVHADAYRLDSGEDLKKLGFLEILKDPETLVFIEWPEKVAEILPEHIHVECEFVSKNSRKYNIVFPEKNEK